MPQAYQDPALPASDLGVTTPSEVTPPPPPEPPLDVEAERLATAIEVTAVQARESFQWVGEPALEALPDTTFWAAQVEANPMYAALSNDISQFFATAWGGDDLGAAFATQLLRTPEQRQEALAWLAEARQNPELARYAAIGPAGRGLPLPPPVDPALLERVMNDPALFAALSVEEKASLIRTADEMLSTLSQAPQDDFLVGEHNRAMAVAATGDVSFALDSNQIAALEVISENALRESFLAGTVGEQLEAGTLEASPFRNLEPGATRETPELGLIGIEQVRARGEGVIVLNSDWARQHPADAYAVKTYLEAEMPGVQIQWDRQGIIGSFFDKWGMAVDYISAPVAAAVLQVDEGIESLTSSPEDRQRMLDTADEIERRLQAGEIPADEVQNALGDIARLREDGVIELGWDQFNADVDRNSGPMHAGTGFMESMLRGMELYPGDTGYSAASAFWLITSNIVFDPTTYILPMFGAARAAGRVPKFRVTEEMRAAMGSAEDIAQRLMAFDDTVRHADALAAGERIIAEMDTGELVQEVSRSWLMQEPYRMMARFPEEMPGTRTFSRAVEHLYRLTERVDRGRLATAITQAFDVDPKLARVITDAESLADMEMSLVRGLQGNMLTPPDINRLITELADVQGEIAQAATTAERADWLIGRERWLNSVIQGEDYVRPLRTLPSAKDLRRLERMVHEPFGPAGTLYMHMQEFVEKFPSNLLRNQAARAAASGDPAMVATAKQALASAENFYKSTGAGGTVILPTTSGGSKIMRTLGQRGEVLIDTPNESLRDLVNLSNYLGLPRQRILDLFAPWARDELLNSTDAYRWWTSTWEAIIDESPRLRSIDKQTLREWSDTYIVDRSPGLLSTVDETGHTVPHATLYTNRVDPNTRTTVRQGVPAWEAHKLQGVRIPTLDDLRDMLTVTGRAMGAWEQFGAGGRFLNRRRLGLSAGHTAANSIWRSGVLMGKMPTALPGRILGEQMVRIAAFDYASLVSHPIEWFTSTRTGQFLARATGDEVALFGNSPIHALGAMVDNFEDATGTLLRTGRKEISITETQHLDQFFRAYSQYAGAVFSSPSSHYWHLAHRGDPDAILDAMINGKNSQYGRTLLDEYETMFEHIPQGERGRWAIDRMQQELDQLIGSGPGAERVEAALRSGRAEWNGRVISVGDDEFAKMLREMYEAGEWRPGMTWMNRSAGDYLSKSRRWRFSDELAAVRDFMFRNFYTRPDLAASRSPLFRQMAAREFRNLVRRGYSPERALASARAYAARGVSDYLFTLGARTSGEYFLKNLMPFFPAWRELATTWLKRIPQFQGHGHWILGAGKIGRRADIWLDAFVELGWVRRDERGNLYVPVPGLDSITSLITGANTRFITESPLESWLGVLPNPNTLFETEDENGNPIPWSERMKGLMPSFGAVDGFGLHQLNNLLGGKLDSIEDWATMFGADQSLGPVALDRALEAFGITPPWMSGTTQDLHETMRMWATVDGSRIAMQEDPMPLPQDFEDEAVYLDASRSWAERVILAGERYAKHLYLQRAVMTMALPFSVRIQDEAKAEMETLWAVINALPDSDTSQYGSAIISAFLADNPQMVQYMTGKTQDIRLVDDPAETFDEYMEYIRDNPETVRSQQNWVVFNMMSNSFSLYQQRIADVYEDAGDTPADVLINFDAKEALEAIQIAWRDFEDVMSDPILPGQTQSGFDMLNTYREYQALRDGEDPRLSREQEQFLEFNGMMREYARYFSVNPEHADEYHAMRDATFAALPEGESPLAQATSWYWNEVADPYYERRNELFKQLDDTEPRNQSLIFQQLRDLANEYASGHTNAEHPEWGEFVSPEEYSFLKLREQDRQDQIAAWANLPATFLTEFQREQVGYDVPEGLQDEANRLANIVTEGEHRFAEFMIQHDISTSSAAYEKARREYDQFYAEKAEEFGLTEFWRQSQQPAYRRIGDALNLGNRTGAWGWAVDTADEIREYIEGQDYSPGGTSDIAINLRTQFVHAVEEVAGDDREFEKILTNLEQVLGDNGQPLARQELIETLFFDVFNTSQSFYLDPRE